jgi:[ribosomal protein S5]-alanine N-acetyltransferase
LGEFLYLILFRTPFSVKFAIISLKPLFNMKKHIQINDKIHLTEVRQTDKPFFVKYLNEAEIAANTLLIPHPYTEGDAEFFVKLCYDSQRKHKQVVNWAIRDENEELIGGIGRMMKSEMGSKHKDEIGYWLAQPFRSQGIMTEVVHGFCDYLHQDFNLIRIEAVVFSHNPASMRVVEKAGFEREAYCRNYHVKKGEPIDGVMFVKIY